VRRLLCASLSLLACAAQAQNQSSLAARYTLSGVMEVGSEMELKADGSFDWFFAYGSMDKAGRGRWESDGKIVTLRFDNRYAAEPAFRLIAQGPWDAEAQQMLLNMDHSDTLGLLAQRCPMMGYFGQTAGDDPGLPPADTESQASAAYANAVAARSKMEAAGQAMLDGKADDAALQKAERDWTDAWFALQQYGRGRGLETVAIAKPSLPPACRAPKERQAADLPQSQWSPGLLVRSIADPPAGEGNAYVPLTGVAFKLADGTTLTDNVRPEGLLLIAGVQRQPVEALVVEDSFGTGRTLTFALKPMTNGVVTLGVNIGKMREPPFSTLTLQIDKDGLYAEDLRGRYVREK
jgi:hypothetical protein